MASIEEVESSFEGTNIVGIKRCGVLGGLDEREDPKQRIEEGGWVLCVCECVHVRRGDGVR